MFAALLRGDSFIHAFEQPLPVRGGFEQKSSEASKHVNANFVTFRGYPDHAGCHSRRTEGHRREKKKNKTSLESPQIHEVGSLASLDPENRNLVSRVGRDVVILPNDYDAHPVHRENGNRGQI
ncbi:hypothetical protein ZHAS_00016268 [Anopheles sinensis]|uniref:Uncharacterized protein n=1 Tax=Anopheles sinensis TaxID=74873 RepID=A0A084WDJ7_ANOSI|nr:hypothetical protein ZHAS_00016268 [Anopheles sinensis]